MMTNRSRRKNVTLSFLAISASSDVAFGFTTSSSTNLKNDWRGTNQRDPSKFAIAAPSLLIPNNFQLVDINSALFSSASEAATVTPSFSFPTTTVWKSCAQPRFDEFASYTIGPWITTTTTATTTINTHEYEVEEVMRSCGGAVQGIREIPLSSIFPNGKNEERTYHNRADSGFVYADDGTYTAGLEKWDWDSIIIMSKPETAEENVVGSSTTGVFPKLMMSSLAFPNQRRVWITSTLSELSSIAAKSETSFTTTILQSTVMELARPKRSSAMNEDSQSGKSVAANKFTFDTSTLPENIHWKKIQRVRMPSSSQAWSLPRAKWECKAEELNNDPNDNENEGSSNNKISNESGGIIGWSFIESISGSDDDLFGDVVASGSITVHMMAVCSVSNTVRSAVRCYDRSGALRSVAFLDGVATTNCSE